MAETLVTHIGPDGGGNYEFGWEGPYLQAQLLSDVGKKRKHNEDSCMLSVPDDPPSSTDGEQLVLFAVADGMGGASAGEYASRLTLETISQEAVGPFTNVPDVLREAVQAANIRVYKEAGSRPEYKGMGTTTSAIGIMGDWAYIAQVGDSRVYLSREKGDLHQITNDHSVVAEQVRNGLISEIEAENHALRNLITRAVGIKESVQVDLFALHIQQNDTFLICSDGLSNMVRETELADCLSGESLQGVARRLVGKALQGGGTDNITAVVIRVTGSPPRSRLQDGANEVRLKSGGLRDRLRGIIGSMTWGDG